MDDFPSEFYKAFGIKKVRHLRGLVEDCEVITASMPGVFLRFRISRRVTQLRPGVFRYWFECPLCKRRSFKLYRPTPVTVFACRGCHHLTYQSSLKKTDPRKARSEKTPGSTESLASPLEHLQPLKPVPLSQDIVSTSTDSI